MLTTNDKEHDMIGSVTPVYLLLAQAVGLPQDLSIKLPIETVPLFHWILCWNCFSCLLHLSSLKVQDFMNTEHEE